MAKAKDQKNRLEAIMGATSALLVLLVTMIDAKVSAFLAAFLMIMFSIWKFMKK